MLLFECIHIDVNITKKKNYEKKLCKLQREKIFFLQGLAFNRVSTALCEYNHYYLHAPAFKI